MHVLTKRMWVESVSPTSPAGVVGKRQSCSRMNRFAMFFRAECGLPGTVLSDEVTTHPFLLDST